MFNLIFGKRMQQSRKEHQDYAASLAMARIQGKEQTDRRDFMDFILSSRGESHQLTDEELVHNAGLFMGAGPKTTATVLLCVTHCLLKTPHAYRRVTDEVRAASTLRNVHFSFNPVSFVTGNKRRSPILIAGHSIPPATCVGVYQLSAYHSPLNFHDPQAFRPERWLPEVYNDPSSPFHSDRRDVHKPFPLGPRDCIGRNLAFHEMRLYLALVLWNFDLSLEESMEQWHVQKSFGFWQKPALRVNVKQQTRI
ncbi:heme binding [Ascochyta rabiei]|uniref:Heme binding n=1 Tax=Didymella rabiei TaxID=5454 RepID=A0A162YT85_DIDRA|nr:heme binding [Ascochyta rabiei]